MQTLQRRLVRQGRTGGLADAKKVRAELAALDAAGRRGPLDPLVAAGLRRPPPPGP